MANFADDGNCVFILQDEKKTSAICIRLIDVRRTELDHDLPIPIVDFIHDTNPKKKTGITNSLVSFSAKHGHAATYMKTEVCEQQLLLRQLVYNSQRSLVGFETPPLIGSGLPLSDGTKIVMKPSFILPLESLDADTRNRISSFNSCETCNKPASSFCGRCYIVAYCNAACQKTDLKAHKKFCLNIATGSTQVVKLVDSPILGAGPLTSVFSRLPAQPKDRSTGPEEWFIVKIQCDGPSPMMLHNSDRSFSKFLTVAGDKNGHEVVRKLAQTVKRWDGLKVYVKARHVREGKLEILTGKLPSQDQTW
jgi:hypothetical protein